MDTVVRTSYEISEKVLSGEYSLCRREAARSKVWKLFSKILNKNGVLIKEYVYCTCCTKALRYSNKATSNLIKHKCFVSKLANEDNEISIIETEDTNIEFIETTDNNLTKLLTKWIIKECKPYDLIKSESLKDVFREIASLGSRFGSDIEVERLLPSLSAVTRNVSELYELCLEKVKSDMSSIKENVFNLTTDIWTNNFTEERYIALTVHYLKNGALKHHLLGLKTLGEKNTRTDHNLVEAVKEILDNFDCALSNKSIIVTNGDDNIIKAFPNNKMLTCMTELLNNTLQKSVEDVPEVTEMISACFKLAKSLNKMQLDNPLCNLLSTPYRWEIIYKMLNSVEENWSEINKIMKNENEVKSIQHLSAINKTIQPFEEAIESLEDNSYATIHLVMIYLHELKKSCDTSDSEGKDFEFIKKFKKNIRFNLDKMVVENITTLHKLALFLYPPTNKLLQFSDKEKICIDEECKSQLQYYITDVKPTAKQELGLPNSPVSKRKKLFSDFVESDTTIDPNELIATEIHYYKNTRVANTSDFDVFHWWELQKDNFPLLYKLSCTVLSTPASCAASKRIFSVAGGLIWEKSNRESKETNLEEIIFVNSNNEHDETVSECSS